MSIEELVNLDITNKNVLIIGCPASGKTWLCKKIEKPTHTIIHTDDYKSYGYAEGMYIVLDVVKLSEMPTIVEGIYGYRMLKKRV